MQNLLDNLLIRAHSVTLDSDLAAGRSPETSRRHAARARHLVNPRTRHALADNWEHLLVTARSPAGGLANRAPVHRDRVHRAEPEIREMITALRATGPTPARGIAIAALLLTDGCSPVYDRNADGLAAAVARAAEGMDPNSPLMGGPIESLRG